MESLTDEVETVKAIVGRFFPIYEVRVRPEAIAFYIRIDSYLLDEKFEGLRQELKGRQYIPILRQEGGEHILFIQRKPKAKVRGPILNLILLIATVASTVYAGMLLWASTYGQGSNLYTLSNIVNASIFFALPLMAILGTHEMGHYIVAKRHGVAASLPFFIPAPLTLIGTLGALISMREPIPNKKALLDIGIAGPLAGLAVAFPITLIGLYMNALDPRFAGPNIGGGISINLPLIYTFLLYLVPLPNGALLHPTAFAGWVGFFVTAINLLPAGQLDGGHVARALLGEKSRYLSYAAFLTLLILGFMFFFSWLILAFFVLLIGLKHPPPLNDISEIHVGRKSLGFAVLIVLILSFTLEPLVQIPVETDFEFRTWEDPELLIPIDDETGIAFDSAILAANRSAVYRFFINNTGNVKLQIALHISAINLPEWDMSFTSVAGRDVGADNVTISLNAQESASVIVQIEAPFDTATGQEVTIDILGETTGGSPGTDKKLNLNVST